MTSTPKLDNNADPEELLKRPLDQVHFKFDEKEEAYRGCAKLKAMHDKCFTTWYTAHFVTPDANAPPTTAEQGRGVALQQSLEACARETALYNKCLQAKLDALGLAHLKTNALAKDDD